MAKKEKSESNYSIKSVRLLDVRIHSLTVPQLHNYIAHAVIEG
jgi:hypothetical protein